jgi:hypothetical protein
LPEAALSVLQPDILYNSGYSSHYVSGLQNVCFYATSLGYTVLANSQGYTILKLFYPDLILNTPRTHRCFSTKTNTVTQLSKKFLPSRLNNTLYDEFLTL